MKRSLSIPRRRTHRNERGFTLLEVLVALTILSLSVAVLFGIFSQGLARARHDMATMHARLLAQSLLAQMSASPITSPASGVDPEGYSWLVRLAPHTDSDASSSDRIADVSVRVAWRASGQQRVLTLTTLTFASREASR